MTKKYQLKLFGKEEPVEGILKAKVEMSTYYEVIDHFFRDEVDYFEEFLEQTKGDYIQECPNYKIVENPEYTDLFDYLCEKLQVDPCGVYLNELVELFNDTYRNGRIYQIDYRVYSNATGARFIPYNLDYDEGETAFGFIVYEQDDPKYKEQIQNFLKSFNRLLHDVYPVNVTIIDIGLNKEVETYVGIASAWEEEDLKKELGLEYVDEFEFIEK